MKAHPTGADARQRLQAAQRAEAVALSEATKAYAARARVQARVDAADRNIAEAVAKLAEVSGLDRAAQLLDQRPGVVRRAVHAAESNRSGANTARPISP